MSCYAAANLIESLVKLFKLGYQLSAVKFMCS